MSGTDTVVWISEGRKVDYIPLRILLGRIQLDLDDRIAKYGPDAVPGLHPQAPKYSYYTTTPQGTECYFFISAFSQGALTYRLINETLAGLKVFLVGPGRNEQAVFQVEDRERMEAFGGLSVGPQARNLEALSNDTSVAR